MPLTISGDTPNFSAATITTGTITTGTITTATITTGTVTTLNAPSGVLATQNGMTGIAKAWVNFDGTGTVAIRSSFNVSSITDNGTGDYTVNFTTAMPNANYCPVLTAGSTTVLSGVFIACGKEWSSAPTTSAYRMATCNFSAFADLSNVYAAFFSS